jgi:hypothetical protein
MNHGDTESTEKTLKREKAEIAWKETTTSILCRVFLRLLNWVFSMFSVLLRLLSYRPTDAAAFAVSPTRRGGRPLRPTKMRKVGFRWVTALHGNLTHLIFVQPHPSKVVRRSKDDDWPCGRSVILEQALSRCCE